MITILTKTFLQILRNSLLSIGERKTQITNREKADSDFPQNASSSANLNKILILKHCRKCSEPRRNIDMKIILNLAFFVFFLVGSVMSTFADFKLRQQVTMGTGSDSFTQERAIWVKGTRERTENRFISEDERMSQMMPQIAEVRQCDLRQTLRINDRSKRYLIEPFYETDDKPLPSVPPSTKTETIKGGTINWTYTLTDTGERRQMFGLTARRLIVKQITESSKDSCQGESKMNMTEDGWFVYLIPENARCMIDLPRGEGRETNQCRDKLITKGGFQYPGMMLEGTTKMVDVLKKDEFTTSVKTLELSKATLEMALFEIPVGYSEVNSEQSLMSFGMNPVASGGTTQKNTQTKKSVAIDFFSGSVSKLNQNNLRQYLAQKLSANGANGVLINSQNEIASGAYANVIGVEIKSAKESGASKIGGLFGKVTGSDDAAKLGKSEAEVVVTLFDKDGKTIIASGTGKEKVDGKAEDAVKAAIDNALLQVLPKLK